MPVIEVQRQMRGNTRRDYESTAIIKCDGNVERRDWFALGITDIGHRDGKRVACRVFHLEIGR